MEKLKTFIKGLSRSKTKTSTDTAAWELAESLKHDPYSLDISHLVQTHPTLAKLTLSEDDMVFLKTVKSALIADPSIHTLQKQLAKTDHDRTDLAQVMTFLHTRILSANMFNHTDVEWMNKNLEAFVNENLSEEDLATLQGIVEEYKKDNSIAKMYDVMNRLPEDRKDLMELAGYLHFKVMFNHH